jgi:hypothetical protein
MLPASRLSSLPHPKNHPVLLSRALLYLALGIQNLHPAAFDLGQLDLGCTPVAAMQKFLDTACRLVTSNDELIECLEGLECLVLEGVFCINCGNLRRAWRVFRRAISVAQFMGLHRGDYTDISILDPDPTQWHLPRLSHGLPRTHPLHYYEPNHGEQERKGTQRGNCQYLEY